MTKKDFFLGVVLIAKFFAIGAVIVVSIFLFENRYDLMQIDLEKVLAFLLGGVTMIVTLFREINYLLRENASLKRQLAREKKEIQEFKKTLEKESIETQMNFH